MFNRTWPNGSLLIAAAPEGSCPRICELNSSKIVGGQQKRPPLPPPNVRFNDQTAPLPRSGLEHRPAPIGAIVRVLGAKAQPATLELRVGVCVLGSGPSCDIVISEPTVSRQHVELGLVPEGVTVKDLGSRNGTFYQGQRVEKTAALAFETHGVLFA